jgi:hypothetical protein
MMLDAGAKNCVFRASIRARRALFALAAGTRTASAPALRCGAKHQCDREPNATHAKNQAALASIPQAL